jgi:hypothetical protein
MKTMARVTGLALMAAWWTGCVVSIGGGEGTKTRHEVPKPPPPVVVMPANTEDAATLAEIDAAAKLSFDSGKVSVLKNVAARPSLSPSAQVHLVNSTLRNLSFDAGKVEVLKVLIENPGFSPAAKEAIFRQTERLSFDSSRSAVIESIQQRTNAEQ